MNDDHLKDIEREIRAWTHRAPACPPGAARTRVLARIAEHRGRPRWRLAAVAAVLALALTSGLVLLRPESPTAPSTGSAAVASAQPPAAGLLVYELRSGTKLYFALTSPRAAIETPAESTFQK